jgi:hypothetical protein
VLDPLGAFAVSRPVKRREMSEPTESHDTAEASYVYESYTAPPQPVCTGCGRFPGQILEYSKAQTGSKLSPADYVRAEEGTYNYANGHFLCTECYIKAGMPSEPGGWVAP